MSINAEKVELYATKWELEKDQEQRHTCPHCYKTHIGVMKDEGWFQW